MLEGLRQTGIRTDDDVRRLIGWLKEPRIGTRRNCGEADHVAPFKFVADVLTDRVQDFIAWANRSGGKSYLAGLITWAKSSIIPGVESAVLAGSLEQAGRVYKAMNSCWAMTGLQDDWLFDRPTRKATRWRNGSLVSVLTASTKSARGPHPQRVILDEIDEMAEDVYSAAMSQAQSKGDILASIGRLSTNHKIAGMMEAAIASAKENEVPIYKWCIAGETIIETDRGGVAIQDMTGGEKVLTLEGLKAVAFVGRTGYNKTIRIKTNAGLEIRCTADHLIFTRDGWRRAGELKTGAEIFSRLSPLREGKAPAGETMPGLLHGSITGRPPGPGDDRQAPGSKAGERAPRQGADIHSEHEGENGLSPAGTFQKNAGMEQGPELDAGGISRNHGGPSQAGAIEQDSDVDRANALQDTRKDGNDLGAGNENRILPGRRFYPGIEGGHRSERKLLALFTESQVQGQGQGNLSEQPRIQPFSFDRNGIEGRSRGDEESIGLDRIIEIEPGNDAGSVYDLTVDDGPPHFFANGILVHNCIWEVLAPCRDYACSTCKISPWCPGTHMKTADGYYSVGDFLNKIKNVSEATLQIEWFCRKLGRSDLVYGEQFDEGIHAASDIPGFDPSRGHVFLSIDWGGTHPFSLGVWQAHPDLEWVRVDEIYKDNTTNSYLIEEAKERPWWPYIWEGVADPSRPDLIKEWAAPGTGIRIIGADNDVDPGIAAVRNALKPLFGRPRFRVCRHTCQHWLNEIRGYYQRKGKPVKEQDHAMDETRYFVRWKLEPPKRKGKVWTPASAAQKEKQKPAEADRDRIPAGIKMSPEKPPQPAAQPQPQASPDKCVKRIPEAAMMATASGPTLDPETKGEQNVDKPQTPPPAARKGRVFLPPRTAGRAGRAGDPEDDD